MTRGLQTIATFRRRLGDESGHVGILMAMALFAVVGMLMMTWNTAQLSKEKMRLQNAADSAALGFCTWQARGMNAVQNINDEMYVSLSIADKLLVVAVILERTACALEKLERTPFVGPLFAFFAHTSHIIALLTGGTSGWLASRICPWILNPLGYFYAYGSAAFGWWGAQQLARLNGADPIGGRGLSWDVTGKWSLGFYAAGLSFPLRDTVLLPIEQQKDANAPWKHKDWTDTFKGHKTKYTFYETLHGICGTGKAWEFKPWVSLTEKKDGEEVPRTPGPSIWFAYKSSGNIETLSLDQWKKDFSKGKIRSMPMFAVAAAQCVSGDVVAHSKKPGDGDINQRRAGFGTGATAKLIPVATALKALNKTVGKVVGAAIYH